MWKKVLVLILAAIISLSAGFGVGYLVQNGGFAGIPAMLGFGETKETAKTDWSDKTLTTGENIVNVRVSPKSDGEVIATLNKNTEVVCLNQDTPDWCYVQVMDGVEGYVVESFMTLVGDYKPTADAEKQQPAADKKSKTSFVYLNGDYANVRKTASSDSEVLGLVLKDDVLQKISEKEGWVQVKTADGVEGYITSDLVAKSDAVKAENAPRKSVEITNSYANMRKDASSDSDLVTKLDKGETATYLGEDNGWYYVLLDDGKTAYVRNDLASVSE